MKRQLIVARYKENIDWVHDCGIPYIIYDKGGDGLGVALLNTGREAHTYLHHIINNYDNLADITIFCQGDPTPNCAGIGDFLARANREVADYSGLSRELLMEDVDCYTSLKQRLLGFSTIYYFSQGANFAVTKERIQFRSLDFYQELMSIVLGHHGPWLMERLWESIFLNR